MDSSKAIYLIDGLRTPIGNPNKSLKEYSAAKLAAIVIKEIVRRNKIKKHLVDEVVLGNTVSAGTGQNVSRQACLMAGLSNKTPAYTVNNVCGAGLQSVISAVRSIKAGDAQLIIAGGTESATLCPLLVSKDDEAQKSAPIDSLQNDGLFCQITGKKMGELVEKLSKKHHITREEQDQYSFESHHRAVMAQEAGVFIKEIVALKTSEIQRVEKDDRPRRNITLERLGVLPPAFVKKGSVTAGNSSAACDGAAVILISSSNFVEKYRLKPKARIVDYASISISPELTFEAIITAIQTVLKKCGLKIEDIDLFEINEAFASQIILTKNKLKIPTKKLNIFGGDIAFGHPLGAAGARILATLVNGLRNRNLKKGLASISYGGGGAVAMIIESC